MSFKFQIVQEIEKGCRSISEVNNSIQSHGTVLLWLRKFGNFDRENQITNNYVKITRTEANGA